MTRRLLVIPVAVFAFGCTRASIKNDTTAARADSTRMAGTPAPAPAAADSSAKPAFGIPVTESGVKGPKKAKSTASAGADTSAAHRGVDSAGQAARKETTVARSDAADTARGIVAVVGTSFDSKVVIKSPTGGRSVTLIGPLAQSIGRLSGADVWVNGTRDENGQINASRFQVRTVDGIAALDGTLITHNDRLVLVTRDGKQHPIDNPPPALRDHIGARVWVAGPLDKGPVTFGVIEERR